MISPFIASHLGLVLTLFVAQSSAQVPTAGVSIVSDPDYVTARPCIQTCIWYNGGLGRGGNSGFDDVGKGLGCGQSPINACYCSDRLTVSATSYLNSCISKLCTVTDPADLSTALSLYGRYCSTANQNAAVVTTSTSEAGQGGSSSSPSATSGSSPTQTSPPTSTGSSMNEPASSSTGLNTTSKIALGVGLGIGIPLLILLAAILIILVRRQKGHGGNDAGMGGIETSPKH